MNFRFAERAQTCRIARVLGVAMVAVLLPCQAMAHVKWFCGGADVTSHPVSPRDVLSPIFLMCSAGFLLLVFLGLLADGWIVRRLPGFFSSGARLELLEDLLIRVGIGVYCLLLWDKTAVVPWGHIDGAILTPELLGHDTLTNMLQLAVAVLVLNKRSCGLAGLALLALIGIGVARYGLFHMTDYVYFVGFALYLGLTSWGATPRRQWRFPLLSASLGFSLMWTAIEKFLYPQWTAQILVLHPNITMGFPVTDVVTIAGFVEFSLAFYLIVGRGLLRFGAAALMVVFISAMPEFGHLDVVGHLPILAILLTVILRGSTPLHDGLRLRGRGPAYDALAVCGLYVLTLAGMAAMYYGLQLTATRA